MDIVKPSRPSHWSERIRPRASEPMAFARGDTNQRWSHRKRSDIPAYVISDKLPESLRCVVRDTSSSGALIQLLCNPERRTVDDLPDTFHLVMLHYKERTEVRCVVVRRFGESLGVRFTGSFVTKEAPTRPVVRSSRPR